jgi:hypothetical protein
MRTCSRLARTVLAASLAAASLAAGAAPAADAVGYAYGQVVRYPLVFPVAAPHTLGTRSHFWDQRYNGDHHAQDIMADKMIEVYAAASGRVRWVNWSSNPEDPRPEKCCSVVVHHDDGWETVYIHLNNDLDPEADDGQGWGIAPGVVPGARVERGQLLGWVGDSGNAEETSPHLHFELWAPGDVAVDSFRSLQEAEAAQGYLCAGQKATRVDADGDHAITGTAFADVIVGSDEAEVITGRAGDDLICASGGDDIVGGGAGADVLLGGEGADNLRGGPGRDLLVASPGPDTLEGGSGRDTASFATAAAGMIVDLAAGTAAGGSAALLAGIEAVRGSPHADQITGDGRRNVLAGWGGDDLLAGAAGNDRLLGGAGTDAADGGDGTDTCRVEAPRNCEP